MAGRLGKSLEELYGRLAQASRSRESAERFRAEAGRELKGVSRKNLGELLCEACNIGDAALVKVMLENGADPNVRGSYKPDTALAIALCGDSVEVLDLLLEYGAKIECKDVDGWTPLAWAAYMGAPEFVKILLARGANPNARSSGWTPLMHAMSEKEIECAEVLVPVSNLKIRSLSPNPVNRIAAYEFAKSCGLDGIAGLIEARLCSIKEKKALEKRLGAVAAAGARKKSPNL